MTIFRKWLFACGTAAVLMLIGTVISAAQAQSPPMVDQQVNVVSNDPVDPIGLAADTSVASAPNSLRCDLLFPFVTNQAGFDTGIALTAVSDQLTANSLLLLDTALLNGSTILLQVPTDPPGVEPVLYVKIVRTTASGSPVAFISDKMPGKSPPLVVAANTAAAIEESRWQRI